ncbi:hypothetical protein JOF28_002522 [Leucobacter exalbidus]|uniref:Desulfoferrodoxin n=1 Tax=Leucobacter exalbidus TaxID=662960 RepID=A0A940PW22_9MICO|nr:hypothetical protein [Leucobacter exalbidus]MBP1327290.1 hypothetical protein [Leucobacter exalbidus]
MSEGTNAPNGSRVKCEACNAEAIIVKAENPSLSCCGQALTITFKPGA